jgi:hypothetical protein
VKIIFTVSTEMRSIYFKYVPTYTIAMPKFNRFIFNVSLLAFLLISNETFITQTSGQQKNTPPKTTTSNVISTTPETYGPTDEASEEVGQTVQEEEYIYIDDPLLHPDDNISRSDDLDLGNDNDTDSDTYSAHAVILNQTNAKMFKMWIDAKSEHLHQLNMNYSGFKLLNETYNHHLLKDAKFAWIDFTKMIVNISKTISQVLYDKTQVVKNLSVLVEKAFNEYANNSDRVVESTNHVYYDAKSPKTFCDTAQIYDQNRNAKHSGKQPVTNKTTTATSKPTISSSTSIMSEETKKVNKRYDLADLTFDSSIKSNTLNNPSEIQFNLKSSSSDSYAINNDMNVENLDNEDLDVISQSEKEFYSETGEF